MKPQLLNKKREVRQLIFFSLLFIVMLAIIGSGCQSPCGTDSYMSYEPIYAPISEVRVTADFITTPQEVVVPGKLYFIDNHIFISEIDEGIHVFDNTDPSNPKNVGFIDLPGNKDLAGKDGFLYADNYMDLVILDISNKTDIQEVNRIENAFEYYYYIDVNTEEVLIDYIETEVEYEIDCFAQDEGAVTFESATDFSSAGVGGSMARFTVVEDQLYTINEYQMQLFDISTCDSPIKGNNISLGWGIETIFPYEDKLFIGSRVGMHIYDNSTPASPTHISSYEHVNACDPVVVQDDIAYVTLRSGTECETFTNQLDVVDISNISEPTLIATHQMDNPHGLGITGDCLFITEGDYGLKLFNASDPLTIGDNLIKHHEDINAFDVIPLNEVLLMIGEDGLYQYEYDCNEKLELLSVINY